MTTEKSHSGKIVAAFTLAILIVVSPVFAGITDTGTPLAGWSGVTPFDNLDDLSGTVEWAVFGPGDFPFSGYVPTPGEFTYVYQVHSTTSIQLSTYNVPVINPFDNAGSFTDLPNGVSGSSATPSGTLIWTFAPTIGLGASSEGMVFSSPNTPMESFSIIVDGGMFANPQPIPVPSEIPEPSAFLLLGMGIASLVATRRFRRCR